jgi:hypothetical protein
VLRTVTQAATTVEYQTASSLKRELARRPLELKRAEEQLRRASDITIKRQWRATAQRLRRRWKAKLTFGKLSEETRNNKTVNAPKCDGHVTVDRTAWAKELQKHCYAKYTDEGVDGCKVASWRARLEKYRLSSSETATQVCEWDINITMDARTRFLPGKAAGGGDDLVPEMVLALPWAVVYIIHCLFARRFHGRIAGEPPSWRRLMLVFLAKVRNAVELNEFRGIALLSVLAKWYMACIMVLLREYTRQRMGRSWTRHLIFGFEEGHNTEQIVVGLTLLVQRGAEWHHVRPVTILSADVKAAFDELSIDTIISSLM